MEDSGSTSFNKENSKIEWTKEMVTKLIEYWESHENLYNPRHSKYFNKHAKNESLTSISNSLKTMCPEMSIDEVTKKCRNLRSQYNHEKEKIAESRKSGAGTDFQYTPKAYWYNMLYFLDQFIKPRKSKSNFDIDIDTATTSIEIASPHVREEVVEFETIENYQLEINADSSPSLLSPPPAKKLKTSRISNSNASTPQAKGDESINENEVLRQASEALKIIASTSSTRATSAQKYSVDLECFGEYIKSELQSLNENLRNQAKRSIFDIIMNLKTQQNKEE